MSGWAVGRVRYFRAHRQVSASTDTRDPRRNAFKVGRNDACPCDSGKKYKRCCGSRTIH
ncbi:MAG: SEC-C metal-binding domain-containing protein [Candidatus Sulfotelmatobacter sp.]